MQNKTAEVNAIFPDKVSVTVYDLDTFQQSGEAVRVGSYLRIVDRENAVLIAMVESFTVLTDTADSEELSQPPYKLDARPLGTVRDGHFERGSAALAIPPRTVEPARRDEIRRIFEDAFPEDDQFLFSHLA